MISIKSYLRRRLRISRILVESPISLMPLLLDRRPKLQQIFRHLLSGGLEHIDEGARLRFIVFGEKSYSEAEGACTASPEGYVSVRNGKKNVGSYRPIRCT